MPNLACSVASVQVGGQAILPGAAMFEMAATSATALADDSQTRKRPVMRSVAIAEPIVLPAADSAQVAQLIVHSAASTFELVTAAASGSQKRKHCWGTFAEPAVSRVDSLHGGRRRVPAWLPVQRGMQLDAKTVAATVIAGPHHGSGYLMHPAVLDATLHLSAAAASPSAPQRVRVPTSLSALSVPTRAPHGRLTPSATPQSSAADGAISCSFLLASTATGAVLQLDGLVVKEMPMSVPARPAAATTEPNKTVPETHTELLYETVWQVSEAARMQLSSSLPAVQQPALHPRAMRQVESLSLDACEFNAASAAVSARSQLRIDAAALLRRGLTSAQGSASTVAIAAIHGIELLRRHLASADGGAGLQLVTCGASPPTGAMAGHTKHGETTAAGGAALAAQLRVAATENPDIRVRGLDTALTARGRPEQHESQVQSSGVN